MSDSAKDKNSQLAPSARVREAELKGGNEVGTPNLAQWVKGGPAPSVREAEAGAQAHDLEHAKRLESFSRARCDRGPYLPDAPDNVDHALLAGACALRERIAAPSSSSSRADAITELEAYLRHLSTCRIWECGRWPLGQSSACGATPACEIHYLGTVDSHEFEPQECSCGLDARLSRLRTPAPEGKD